MKTMTRAITTVVFAGISIGTLSAQAQKTFECKVRGGETSLVLNGKFEWASSQTLVLAKNGNKQTNLNINAGQKIIQIVSFDIESEQIFARTVTDIDAKLLELADGLSAETFSCRFTDSATKTQPSLSLKAFTMQHEGGGSEPGPEPRIGCKIISCAY